MNAKNSFNFLKMIDETIQERNSRWAEIVSLTEELLKERKTSLNNNNTVKDLDMMDESDT